MTEGGPLDSTNSVALFIYQNGFQLSKFGYVTLDRLSCLSQLSSLR